MKIVNQFLFYTQCSFLALRRIVAGLLENLSPEDGIHIFLSITSLAQENKKINYFLKSNYKLKLYVWYLMQIMIYYGITM